MSVACTLKEKAWTPEPKRFQRRMSPRMAKGHQRTAASLDLSFHNQLQLQHGPQSGF